MKAETSGTKHPEQDTNSTKSAGADSVSYSVADRADNDRTTIAYFSQKVVAYKNDFNYLALKSFSQTDQDVFFTIIQEARVGFAKEKDKRSGDLLLPPELRSKFLPIFTIKLPFAQLKKTILFMGRSNREFVETLEGFIAKLRSIDFKQVMSNGRIINYASLFYGATLLLDKEELQLKMDYAACKLLYDCKDKFTCFQLQEFVNLGSKYSKSLFRLLMDYKDTGFFIMRWDDFTRYMDFPDKFRTCDVDSVLDRCIKELSVPGRCYDGSIRQPIQFRILEGQKRAYVKEKCAGRGRGGKIKTISFYYKPFKDSPALEALAAETAPAPHIITGTAQAVPPEVAAADLTAEPPQDAQPVSPEQLPPKGQQDLFANLVGMLGSSVE